VSLQRVVTRFTKVIEGVARVEIHSWLTVGFNMGNESRPRRWYDLARIRLSSTLLLGLAVCCPIGLAQVRQQFADQLVQQTVVLRNFYTGHRLKYDANGVLISGGTAGSGPADGRVYVEAVQFQKNRVIIRGERRPISVFNPATGETSLFGRHGKVEIEAELPQDKGTSEATTEMLHRIFLTSAETNLLTCSADEERTFRERMLRAKELVSVPRDGEQNREEPPQLCFPDGNRAYVVGNGVAPPKPLKTPAPAYPPSELGTHDDRRVVLALIIDSGGKPTSLVVVGASVTGFDTAAISAVQGWKFQPATYQGKPVPAAITVEASFPSGQVYGTQACFPYPQSFSCYPDDSH